MDDIKKTLKAIENGLSSIGGGEIDNAVYVDDADWTDNTSKHLNVGGVYQSSPHTVTDGDVTPWLSDANGRQVISLGTLIAGEDLDNDTLGVTQKTVVSSSYSGTAFTDLGALAKDNEKAAAAQLKAISAWNENAAVRYLQIFNLAADPTDDSSVPIFSFPIPAGTANNPGQCDKGADFFGEGGYYLSTGFSWGISVDPDVFDETGVTVGEHQVNGIYV